MTVTLWRRIRLSLDNLSPIRGLESQLVSIPPPPFLHELMCNIMPLILVILVTYLLESNMLEIRFVS